MPKTTDGKSLKEFECTVWFGNQSKPGFNSGFFIVKASNLVGAVGRAARQARLKAKGKFSMATVNVMPMKEEDEGED